MLGRGANRGPFVRQVSVAFLVASLFLAAHSVALAQGSRRVALVVGNSAYQHTTPLKNPRHDATDIAATFTKLGFEVVSGTDLDKPAMDRTIRAFADKLVGASLGVFFYAGHGLQVDGFNYLVPIDAKLGSVNALDFEMVRLDFVQRIMERATNANVLFLDACRDNPLARNLARALGTRSAGVGRGLAPVESGEGTLISFSTQPGNVALDGEGRNSPFATAIVRHIGRPGEDLSSALIAVRNDVMLATKRRQVPWDHSALTARVYLGAPPTPAGPSYEQQAELALWATVKDVTDPIVLQTYLDRYPAGSFSAVAQVLIERLKREAEQNAVAAAREEELRSAEAAQAAAEAAKRESERQAHFAKQSDELRRTQQEARKAREALARAELEREAARKAADEAKAAAAKAKAERQSEAAKSTETAKPASPPRRASGSNCFAFNGKSYCQ